MTNRERIGKAMDVLQAGLGPFVEREIHAAVKAGRVHVDTIRRFADDPKLGSRPVAQWDAAGLLKLMWETWNDAARARAAGCPRCAVGRQSPRRPDSRWALTWFEQQAFDEGDYGVAGQLSKAKNTSVAGMVEAGIVKSERGRVRLLAPAELPADWDPATDPRLTAWEAVHQLIRALASGGEAAAAGLVARLGARAEIARELAYRLYTLCERRKRAAEARAYNGLVQSFPEIVRLAREGGEPRAEQGALFGETEQ
jgi:hypothetical protein